MELRKLLLCAAFLVVAVSQCSEARHNVKRATESSEDFFSYNEQADEANDEQLQNEEGGDEGDVDINATIVSTPTIYNATIGLSYRLGCRTQPSDPGIVVEWYKNGKKIFLGSLNLLTGEDKERFSLSPDTNDLIIKDITFDDIGEYECRVQQTTPVSVTHKIVVTESPTIKNFTASSTPEPDFREGSDVVLQCVATGTPPPNIIWSKEDDNGSNYRLSEVDGEFIGNTFLMRNVTKSKSGKYYCYAFNPVNTYTAELLLVIRGAPRVHIPKTIVNSAVNVSAILECNVHEEEIANIYWYKDGTLLTPSPSAQISTIGAQSNLTLTPANDNDFGTYTCEATNYLGRHSKSIRFVQVPIVEDIVADGPKLSWTVHSHQPLEDIELQLQTLEGEQQFITTKVPPPKHQPKKYEMSYNVKDANVKPGKYAAFVKVKNTYGWSTDNNEVMVEFIDEPQAIKHASVFGGSHGTTLRPTPTAVISTILMYLLVRMY